MTVSSAQLNPDSIVINTLQTVDGTANGDASSIYANSSILIVGNNSISTTISGDVINAHSILIGDSIESNVFINGSSITISGGTSTNTYIDSYGATFSGTVESTQGLIGPTAFIDDSVYVGNTSGTYATINSTFFTATSNNSSYLNNKAESALNVNNALTANNSSNLNGKAESALNVNSALTANSSTYVLANAGIVSNASGVYVNSAYIATISSNSATFLGAANNSGNSSGIYTTGVVTASGTVSGNELTSTFASADEGGQINLAKPPNATTSGGIVIDAYQNRLRIYENGGNFRGAYIDLTAAANGVSTNLLSGGGGGTGTVTSVGSGNGLTGGPITGSGTLSVLANTGIIANATGVYVNSTYIATLTANNSSFLGGTAAASFVQNTDSRTLSGNLNFTGANNNFSGNLIIASTGELIITNGAGIFANGTLGTTGQVLTTNGTSVYWSSAGGGFSNGQSISVNNFVITGALSANSSNGTSGQILVSGGANVYWSNAVLLDVYYANGNFAFNGTGSYVYPRVNNSITISTPLAWNSDLADQYVATAQAANLTISADSGSPLNGQKILFRIKDNGTSRTLTWTTGASKAFRTIGTTLPSSTTANKTLYVGAIYNADDLRWDVIAVSQEV